MSKNLNLKKLSFLIYGLGATGQSVIRYFKKKKIKNFVIWDDSVRLKKNNQISNYFNLKKALINVDFIILSPGVSLFKSKYKSLLKKFEKKIITDIDLLYLFNSNFKSIMVTGTNGKSTTCKIISHLLKKNKFNVRLGGNIGKPILDLQTKKKVYFVIEASSFQLSHSKFIKPDIAMLLNLTVDHLDWHGSMKNYIFSKMKIFKLQERDNFAFINHSLRHIFKKQKFSSKLVSIKSNQYDKLKSRINSEYLKSNANEDNMKFVYSLSKILKISNTAFVKSMASFKGLPHRYEIFLKKRKITFINDSKATSLKSSEFALSNDKNIYWILGGLPKNNDTINLRKVKKNIVCSYIIGKSAHFFKKKLKSQVNFKICKNLENALLKVINDIKSNEKENCKVLFSPGAASFDQFKNFEKRGDEFKRLSKKYAKKIN